MRNRQESPGRGGRIVVGEAATLHSRDDGNTNRRRGLNPRFFHPCRGFVIARPITHSLRCGLGSDTAAAVMQGQKKKSSRGNRAEEETERNERSPFQALLLGMATRLSTGNNS
jgi:hypothetical protein